MATSARSKNVVVYLIHCSNRWSSSCYREEAEVYTLW